MTVFQGAVENGRCPPLRNATDTANARCYSGPREPDADRYLKQPTAALRPYETKTATATGVICERIHEPLTQSPIRRRLLAARLGLRKLRPPVVHHKSVEHGPVDAPRPMSQQDRRPCSGSPGSAQRRCRLHRQVVGRRISPSRVTSPESLLGLVSTRLALTYINEPTLRKMPIAKT